MPEVTALYFDTAEALIPDLKPCAEGFGRSQVLPSVSTMSLAISAVFAPRGLCAFHSIGDRVDQSHPHSMVPGGSGGLVSARIGQ
jgi:hypothetical protein